MTAVETRPRPDAGIPTPEKKAIKKRHRVRRTLTGALLVAMPTVGGATVFEAQRLTGGSIVSAVPEVLWGPSDSGKITLDADKNYNFVAIGDSLAAGVGGDVRYVDGQKRPESWIYPMVESVNRESPGIAEQQFIPKLAKSGSSAEQLNIRLQTERDQLLDIPNLVLGMSAEYKSVNLLVADIKDHDNLSRRKTERLLKKHLDNYSEDLRDIINTLASIHAERREILGQDSSLSVIALGLPDLASVPQVKKLINEGAIESWQVKLLTNLFNTRLANAMNDANRKRSGVAFAYSNITDLEFRRGYVSSDGLHPTQEGYDLIAAAVSSSELKIAV